MKTFAYISALTALLSVFAGCRATYNADAVSGKELASQSSTVFVRPDKYTILLGTRSVRDYIDIAYEEFTMNEAGKAIVQLGLVNKGGQHFWDLKGKDFTIYVQASFYRDPVVGRSTRSAPLYRTPKRQVRMLRGETSDVKFVCPVDGAGGYQVTISEN